MGQQVALPDAVRMLRETRGLTQQQFADAAGVSLSTVRRVERDPTARFHPRTEERLEYVLGLRKGALEHLRQGGSYDSAFEERFTWFPNSAHYRDAPVWDIEVEGSEVARLLARSLGALGSRRAEELALAAAGRLLPGAGGGPERDLLFDWLPWPAKLAATPVWLHRLHDSAEQVRSVLEEGVVPRPLRMAEAVLLRIAHDRAEVFDATLFDDDLDDPLFKAWDALFDLCDPRPLFDRARVESEWVPESHVLHPLRWWAPN